MRGNKVFYQGGAVVVSNGNSSVWASASVAAYVPAVANNFMVNANGTGTCGGGGPGGLYFHLSWAASQLYVARLDCPASANMSVPFQCVLPNVSQTIFYQWTAAYSVGNFASSAFNIEVVGFEVPNDS